MRIFFAITLLALITSGKPASTGQEDQRLDALFTRLLEVSSPAEAATVESSIWRIWIQNSDQRVANRLRQGIAAMNGGELNEALEAFDEVTRQAPRFAEGWNKRATVHFLMRSYDASVRDIVRTLELEPRHFGALSGLGLINDAIARPAAAIRAFKKALTIHPHMSGARQNIRRLQEKLRGEET